MLVAGAVGDNVVGFNVLTLRHHGTLIYAGALVRTEEFDDFVFVDLARLGGDLHAVGVDLGDGTGAFAKHANARVDRSLIFHTGSDNGGIGLEQRNGLTLHVRP